MEGKRLPEKGISTPQDITLLVDTREKPTPRMEQRVQSIGYPCKKVKLNFGDYSAECRLGTDKTTSLQDRFAIERKMGIDEICLCFGKERGRFEREFQRAADAGARLYLLIEDASWDKIISHRYRSRMPPQSIIGSLLAWQLRYDMRILMCEHEASGMMIRNIVKYEAKEFGRSPEGMGGKGRNMNQTLYELTTDFQNLLDYGISDDPEERQAFADTLEGILGAIEMKADNYAAVIHEFEGQSEKIGTEIKRLQAMKKCVDGSADKMKERIKETMEAMGKTAIQTDLHSFKLCKAGGKQAVEITGDVPDIYKKIVYENDNEKIREELETVGELPFARLKPRGTYLKIR